MERALRSESNCTRYTFDCCIIEKVLGWLEKEDTDLEKLAGYGLCVAALTYFSARLLQFIF